MLTWLGNNLGTIIVGVILLFAVVGIILYLVRRKKAGKCVACDACDKQNACSHCKSTSCPSKQDNKTI